MVGRDEKREEEHWGCDGNVNYIDCGGDFTDVYLCHYYCIESKSESEVAQSCPTLCNPIDCSLPGSSMHGIFQARILEWLAVSFSRGSSQPRDWTWVSYTAGRLFTIWATREDLSELKLDYKPLDFSLFKVCSGAPSYFFTPLTPQWKV